MVNHLYPIKQEFLLYSITVDVNYQYVNYVIYSVSILNVGRKRGGVTTPVSQRDDSCASHPKRSVEQRKRRQKITIDLLQDRYAQGFL